MLADSDTGDDINECVCKNAGKYAPRYKKPPSQYHTHRHCPDYAEQALICMHPAKNERRD